MCIRDRSISNLAVIEISCLIWLICLRSTGNFCRWNNTRQIIYCIITNPCIGKCSALYRCRYIYTQFSSLPAFPISISIVCLLYTSICSFRPNGFHRNSIPFFDQSVYRTFCAGCPYFMYNTEMFYQSVSLQRSVPGEGLLWSGLLPQTRKQQQKVTRCV